MLKFKKVFLIALLPSMAISAPLGDFQFNFPKQVLQYKNEPEVQLTHREAHLLFHLIKNKDVELKGYLHIILNYHHVYLIYLLNFFLFQKINLLQYQLIQ